MIGQLPGISIIVPLYNKESYVKHTIESILNQTYTKFEVIIINDGSTDKSLEIVSKFKDSRIKIISQKNQGLPATRNRGIELAKYELIAFLDADDLWLPDFLSTIIHLQATYPDATVYATSYDFFNDRGIYPHKVLGLPTENWEGILPSFFKTFDDSKEVEVFVSNCIVVPKTVYRALGFFNPNTWAGEDIYMWGQIVMQYPLAYTTKSCVLYNITPGKRMSNTFKPMKEHPFSSLVRTISQEELLKHSDYSYILNYIEHRDLETAYVNIGAGEMKFARANLVYVNSKKYNVRKNILKLLSYCPLKLGKYVVSSHSYISRIMKYYRTKKCKIPYY